MAQEFSLEEALGKGTQPTTEFSLDEALGRAPTKERTVGEAFKDVGAGLVSGAGSLVQLPGQLYGLATGDFSKTGALGLGEDISKYGEEMKSAGLKAREAERAAKVQEAEKEGQFAAFKAGFGETITDPALFTSFIAEQVPNILPMILTGGATAALTAGRASAAALAKGATKEAAAEAAKIAGTKAGTTAAIQTGAVMQGADIGAGSYDEIYGELLAKGMSEEQAAAETINKARAAGLTGYGLSVLANRFLPGGKALEEILAGKKITGSRIGSGAVTAIKEIPSENIEEVGGRIAQNVAAQQAGLDRELLAGTGETAAMATLGAIGIGGAAGAIAPRRSESEQAAKEVDAFKQEEAEFRKQFGETKPVEVKEPELPTEFPGGYTATRRELSRQDVPESYGIFPEGADKPLTTVQTQEEAQAKLQTLTEIRAEEQARLIAESDKIDKEILAERRKLDVLEATGQTDTDQYVQSKAALLQREEEAAQQVSELNDRIASYSTPLTLAPVGSRADVQSDYVVKRGDQEIGAFPTLQDAETRLREIEPETFTQAEQQAQVKTDDRVQQLKQSLTPMLAKFGLQDVGLNVVAKIENDAGGKYSSLDRLIDISLRGDAPIQTMRHESLHALKDLQFFTPQQWNALTERANKQWIKEYLQDQQSVIEVDGKPQTMSRLDAYKRLGYTQEAIVEEAIADAFGAYDKGATPPPGMIAALFKKLKNFFANFGQALRGAGFESADDVFQRVERGELKSRKPKAEAKVEPKAEPKAQPQAEPKEEPSAQPKSSLKKTKLVPLDLMAGPNASSYVPEYLTPLKDALAKGNTKLISLKDGAKVHLVSGQDINGKDKFAVIALNEQGNEVGRLSFYENKDGSLDNINVGVAEKFRRKGLAMALYDAAEEMGFVFPSAEDKSWRTEEGQAFREARAKYKATPKDIKQADKYEEENGIRPYTPEGPFDVPTTAPKYSLQKFNPDKHLSFDPTLGVPINRDGTVTVYYHTTKAQALAIGKSKVIPAEGRNRVYLTNESGGDSVLRNRGSFDQELDGSTVLVYVTPDMLQVDAEYPNGRRDFFIPLEEGDFFNKKMKMQSIQKGRDEAITGEFSYSDHEAKMTKAVEAYKEAPAAERRAMLAKARKTLKSEHNVGSLLSENGKLEKTRVGEYGLEYEGNSVASQGLGLAAAQKITEKVSTCPRSAICEGLCLGETSGGNFLFGGTATEDVADIKKSAFRAGPRMMQYLKTEALIINPEAFAILLQAEIDSLKKWSASPTQVKIDPETKKRLNVEKEIYQPAVRLNVTSDFKPEMFRAIIEGNPDVQFYDYTKLGNEPLSDNHHLTYSSTGFGQIVNGEKVFFKTKAGQYDHNWATMRKRLDNGQNVAMAFSSKSALPKILLDEETKTEYKIWDGDDYDARFLDPKQPNGRGMIIGLRNKAGNLSEKNATERTGGFFVQYNPKTDGDTVVVPDQAQFKDGGRKVIPLTKDEKFSLRTSFPSAKEAENAAYDKAPPSTKEFKLFFGGSTIMDEGRAVPMFHGSQDIFTQFRENKPIFVSPSAEEAERYGGRRAEKGESVNVYPLWVRAETPFDYENPEHVQQVMNKMAGDKTLKGKQPSFFNQGHWENIEDKQVQDAIKSLGFDSFFVNEGGEKNLAVFKAEQVKSITGNIGDFSRESKDMRFSLKKVRYSPDRFQKLWDESMYTQNDAENKTKGYLAFVNPLEFVNATASPYDFDRLRREQEPLDVERLKAYDQVPFLTVSEKNGNWKITGHEGRHRMLALHADGYREVPVYIHLRAEDAKSIPVKALTAQYDDSLSSVLMIAEVEPLSYANKQKAMEKFTRMESRVKYSLPTIPQNLQDRMGETTSRRERKTIIQSIIDAITPTSAADFRAKYLNRYNQMSVYDKKLAEQMGGAALLADQSAESSALMSDLGAGVAASAMGFDDRNGGIPVLRNGITTIDKSVKGLIASLGPLAAYGDPAIYQRYQYWAMVKRGQRLNKEGKLTGIDSADVAFAKILEQKHPEFVSVQKDLIAFNNGLVQYMVDTGVLSKERGQIYTKYADYIPFYRQMDGDKTLGPNLFQSLSGVKPPKKLKGAVAEEAPIADFLETMVRNTQSSIQAGIKNYAAQRALNVAVQVKAPGMEAERLNYVDKGPDIINVLEKGNLVSYRTTDTLLVNAMMSLNQSELPFIGFLSAPADWLRTLVTKEPGFMMANMLRDSLSAWVTSGQKMTPIAGTVINFGKAIARTSPGFEAMLDAGIIGGYEFSENIEKSGFKLEDDLAKKAGKKAPLVLRPFKSVWDALGKGTTASDAATRALIYERVLADTGNEAEALYRSLEVMNFHRKGSSPLIRVLTAAIPFFNARLQGLDLFYRASTGNMNNKDAASIQRQFFMRGMTMMALSGLYWMLVSDDEEYKKQEQETKDNNWIIPSLGVKIPIPFEVGVLFKVIPERIMAYSFGNDTGEDLQKSMIRSAVNTFAFNPIPQTIKPVLEAYVDYNMFTMRPILGQGMKDIEPEFQVGPSTSNFAKLLAQNLGLSPMKVDHIIKGYTGTIGMYAIDTIDIMLDQFGDSPKPTKRFEQLPVIKRFASDPESRGFVTQYYELKDAVDTTVRTMNLLERTGQYEEYAEYLVKNQGTLAFKDYVRDTEKTLKDLRDMRTAIRSSTMTGDEKRDSLLEISRVESAITANIQEIKKAIAQAQ